MLIDEITRALSESGLHLRGGFLANAGEFPSLEGDRPVHSLLLVGNVGPAMWERFSAQHPAGSKSLDGWTEEVLAAVAGRFAARALFPFQRPFLPFQQWLMRADRCYPSPIGILIHPRYGLWHALRGALLLEEIVEFPEPSREPSPCETCADRPCLTTCPAGAFSESGYDVPRCVAHLSDPAGQDCMSLGCRSRRACPYGNSYRYDQAQASFHMAAFRAAHGGSEPRQQPPPQAHHND